MALVEAVPTVSRSVGTIFDVVHTGSMRLGVAKMRSVKSSS